jgi:hypothetical protein
MPDDEITPHEELSGKEKRMLNLTPIKPGEVLNPKGRGKGTLNAKTIINKWLDAIEEHTDPETGEVMKISNRDAIIKAQILKAKKGDTWAFNSILDRTDGKPIQGIAQVDNDGNDVAPIKITLNLG